MKFGSVQNSPVLSPRPAYEWMRWLPAIVLGLIALAAVVISSNIILVPLLSSLALAFLLNPAVIWFEKRGWNRATAVLLTLTAAMLLLILILLFVLPNLWEQITVSIQNARELLTEQRARQFIAKLDQINPRLSRSVQNAFEVARKQIPQMGLGWLQGGLAQLVTFTSSLLDLLLIPFFVYYLLADYRVMMSHLERLVPPRFRPTTGTLTRQVSDILSTYVRSQLLIGFVMGALYAVGFAVLRVPLAVTLGLLSGLLNFIPYLGTLIGFILSIAFLALDGAGFARIGGVLIVFTIVQSVEGYYLTPKLLGDKLNLHPLWVIIGLVIGGNLFGLIGIILAVPFIAIAQVVLGFLEEIYQESQFYRRARTELLTGSGNPVNFGSFDTPLAGEPLIMSASATGKAPRLIITTSEIESRLRDSSEDSDSSENL